MLTTYFDIDLSIRINSLLVFVINTNDLEVKFQLCMSFIVKEVMALDPLARR